MFANVALLVIFGTTISSGHMIARLIPRPSEITNIDYKPQSSGCPSGPELAPIICKFMQANLDMYYKPNLIAPSTYIPSIVMEKCDSPKLEMEIELPAPIEEKRPIVIPQPPELPPITIPKFPVPMIIEEHPAPLSKPIESYVNPEMPFLIIPTMPELTQPALPQIMDQPETQLNEEAPPEINYDVFEHNPTVVPQPPELPAYATPDFVVRVFEPESPIIAVPPCLEDESIPEAPAPSQPAVSELGNNLFQNLPQFVSQPPKLPDFVRPEFPDRVAQAPASINVESPVHVEIPSGPELPPMHIPSAPIIIEQPAVPEFENNLFQNEPMSVPQPPALPAFIIPEFPTRVFEPNPPMIDTPLHKDDSDPQAPVPAYIALSPVPAAPELPPMSLPEFPVRVEIPSELVTLSMDIPSPLNFIEQPIQEPCVTEHVSSEVDNNFAEFRPMSLPQPPALPAFIMPELPVRLIEQEPPHMIAAPHLEEESIPQAAVSAYTESLAPIPFAPELSPVSLPEFPVRIEIPSAPVLPPMDISSPPKFIEQPIHDNRLTEVVAPEIDNNFIEFRPIWIPQPPGLPAFAMPELPEKNVEPKPSIVSVPYLEYQAMPVVTIPKCIPPLEPLPAAPQVPPAIDVSVSAPYLEYQAMPVVTIPKCIPPREPLPAAPQVPAAIESRPNEEPAISQPNEEPALPQPEQRIVPQPPKLSELVMPELPKFEPRAKPTYPAFVGEPCKSWGKPTVDIAAIPNSYFKRYFPSAVKESQKL